MGPIPFPTGKNKQVPETSTEPKQVPIAKIEPIQVPAESVTDVPSPAQPQLIKPAPEEPELTKEEPSEPELTRETPTETALSKEEPSVSEMNKEMPSNVNIENCVEIDGKLYEIKPTKLKYFRNKMAAAYNVIKAIPLSEFLTYDKGVIDPEKDADQILYDYLVAAFDDPDFVHEHYEDMTADDVEKVINIFGRLNHIEEKEEKARKNREAQASKH